MMLFPARYPDYFLIDELTRRSQEMQQTLDRIEAKLEASVEIDPKLRYSLTYAANVLGVSTKTLGRRADEGRIHLLRDGKRLFVSGAEILRYVRETGGSP